MAKFDLHRFISSYNVAIIDTLIDVVRVINREELDLDTIYKALHSASVHKHKLIAKGKVKFYKEQGVPEPYVVVIDDVTWVRDSICPLCNAVVWLHHYCGRGIKEAGVKACRLCHNHPHISKGTGGSGECEFEEYLGQGG